MNQRDNGTPAAAPPAAARITKAPAIAAMSAMAIRRSHVV